MRKLILALAIGAAAATAQAEPLLGGFVEGAWAVRTQQNPALDGAGSELGFIERAYPRDELRGQLTLQDGMGDADVFLRFDLVSDARASERTQLDLREAYVKLYLTDWLDIKAGRQVATWGTGDLVFANDLFAKDWQAFFTGLDDAYLKPPQDLLRLSAYLGGATAELALSPDFTPDNLPDGTRLAVYNPFLGEAAAAGAMPEVRRPAPGLRHGEIFGRLYGTRGSLEWALYGYKGFWPTPQAVLMPADAESAPALGYPRLASGGASLRGPVGAWLVSLESAYYASLDDGAGDDPTLPNSELRGIAGVERSLGGDWMLGAQWFAIGMMNHDAYLEGVMPGGPTVDALRHTLTFRLTKMALDQRLVLSLFAYAGVTDGEWHLRPSLSHKLTEAVKLTLGASLLDGDHAWTQFGQFAGNDLVYARLRYSF
ncbi:MAG: hypothetical protein R3C71_04445 [Candidatus Krumholzibacteriia bacterium]|nr:hypothetical protein [Candidatus Latescibacterota bacterium]MCB9514597.1 hypothetical protein [Candidatus Latescibacterota bacterium]